MAALAAIVVALPLAFVGCGSTKTASSSGAQLSGGNQQAFTRFRERLQTHGVKPPSGPLQSRQPGQRPSFDANTQAAFQACSQYRPARLPGQGGLGG